MRSITHRFPNAHGPAVRPRRTYVEPPIQHPPQQTQQPPTMKPRSFIDTYTHAAPYLSNYVKDWIEKNRHKLDLNSSEANAPGNSTFAMSSAIVTMSQSDIESFLVQKQEMHQGVLYGIGKMRIPSDCNPLEVDGFVLEERTQSTRPGLGKFKEVVCGGYDYRPYKYLYVIDVDGLHLVREFTECEKSSRGIAVHSLIKSHALIGGEAFFDAYEPGRVYINFGSSRCYPTSAQQMENTVKYWLACGYEEVVAVYSSRDLQQKPYGMKDRYGKNLPNVIYRRDEKQLVLSEVQQVNTTSHHTEVTFNGRCYR